MNYETREGATRDVVNSFKRIDQVVKIYCRVCANRIHFFVFTDEQVYDDDLLSRLIDVECDLRDLRPETKQAFDFTPISLVGDPLLITGENAALVYDRS